ncbi:hypothetical protein Cgig2_008602 [Carnegiea gigantea]|uniref:Uncharacterized protein n=1 Tax=Carnegiea gigantea TaxID=171969 RepID=A0A9Q1GSD9_9CARY|nr:hypothetical protein Cgig2_008602 [Carnegiea gigantea]
MDSHPLFADFTELELYEEFDEDVWCCLMETDDFGDVLSASQAVKEKETKMFRQKDYKETITRYDRSLQFPYAVVPLNKEELLEFENGGGKAHKDLLIALKFDPKNDEVKKELGKPTAASQATVPHCPSPPLARPALVDHHPPVAGVTIASIAKSSNCKP